MSCTCTALARTAFVLPAMCYTARGLMGLLQANVTVQGCRVTLDSSVLPHPPWPGQLCLPLAVSAPPSIRWHLVLSCSMLAVPCRGWCRQQR